MLPNPERAWHGAARTAIDRAEVERRIGATSEPIEVLTGGLANTHVRIGRDRVLRIQRDPSTLAKQIALLRRPWRALRTPRVLETGADFVVLEYVELQPLPESAGEAVGRALAEIHASTYDGDLARPHCDDFTAREYGHANLIDAKRYLDPALATRIAAFLDSA